MHVSPVALFYFVIVIGFLCCFFVIDSTIAPTMDLSSMDLCFFPAGVPPKGSVINFDNPKTLVPVLISICTIMTVGSVLFTACRLYANRQKLWWSDCA